MTPPAHEEVEASETNQKGTLQLLRVCYSFQSDGIWEMYDGKSCQRSAIKIVIKIKALRYVFDFLWLCLLVASIDSRLTRGAFTNLIIAHSSDGPLPCPHWAHAPDTG